MTEQWYVYNPKEDIFVRHNNPDKELTHLYVEPKLLEAAKELYSAFKEVFKPEFPIYILMLAPINFSYSLGLDKNLIVMVEDQGQSVRYMLQTYVYILANDKPGYIKHIASEMVRSLAIERYLKDVE